MISIFINYEINFICTITDRSAADTQLLALCINRLICRELHYTRVITAFGVYSDDILSDINYNFPSTENSLGGDYSSFRATSN